MFNAHPPPPPKYPPLFRCPECPSRVKAFFPVAAPTIAGRSSLVTTGARTHPEQMLCASGYAQIVDKIAQRYLYSIANATVTMLYVAITIK